MSAKGKAKPSLKRTTDGHWIISIPLRMKLVRTEYSDGVFVLEYEEAERDG